MKVSVENDGWNLDKLVDANLGARMDVQTLQNPNVSFKKRSNNKRNKKERFQHRTWHNSVSFSRILFQQGPNWSKDWLQYVLSLCMLVLLWNRVLTKWRRVWVGVTRTHTQNRPTTHVDMRGKSWLRRDDKAQKWRRCDWYWRFVCNKMKDTSIHTTTRPTKPCRSSEREKKRVETRPTTKQDDYCKTDECLPVRVRSSSSWSLYPIVGGSRHDVPFVRGFKGWWIMPARMMDFLEAEIDYCNSSLFPSVVAFLLFQKMMHNVQFLNE